MGVYPNLIAASGEPVRWARATSPSASRCQAVAFSSPVFGSVRAAAPHGWLRYDVERIRSVRHLTDPEHGPADGVHEARGLRAAC